jgi:hypothetical protein
MDGKEGAWMEKKDDNTEMSHASETEDIKKDSVTMYTWHNDELRSKDAA